MHTWSVSITTNVHGIRLIYYSKLIIVNMNGVKTNFLGLYLEDKIKLCKIDMCVCNYKFVILLPE